MSTKKRFLPLSISAFKLERLNVEALPLRIPSISEIMKAVGAICGCLLMTSTYGGAQATSQTIPGPAGSGEFGKSVLVLPDGGVIVADPGFDQPSGPLNVGAVYLYRGTPLALVSTLKGTQANDQIGSGGVVAVGSGNFAVRSSLWSGGRGAVTWCSGQSGIDGSVTSTNSLVGTKTSDNVGSETITRAA